MLQKETFEFDKKEVPFIHADISLQKRFSNIWGFLTIDMHKYLYIFELKYILWISKHFHIFFCVNIFHYFMFSF